MRATVLTNSKFEKLKEFNPGKNIISSECKLFIIEKKGNKKLLKKFYTETGRYMGQKLLNINTLLDYKKILEASKHLIIPDSIVVVGGEIVGLTMPFIENSVNLQTVLRNSNIPLENKIKYLKTPGEILIFLENISEFPYKIHLGDMHEANFIIDENDKVLAVDLDSAYISLNEPFDSKYLSNNNILSELPYKYKKGNNDKIIPDKNTDIYCYIIMILNTLAQAKMYKISLIEFYNYLNYLESLKINTNFLNCIERIYKGKENENPLPYLDELPIKNLYQAHRLVYKTRTGHDLQKI